MREFNSLIFIGSDMINRNRMNYKHMNNTYTKLYNKPIQQWLKLSTQPICMIL